MVRSSLYFITGNNGKYREASAVIPGLKQLNLQLDEIQSLDPRVVIEHKLAQAALLHDGAFLVEDTSVVLLCLGDKLPGTLIKWFFDELGNEGLFRLVSNYGDDRAILRATFGLRQSDGRTEYFSGQIEGSIVAPRGDRETFGFNQVFQPEGHDKTFAEMTILEKNEVSMRGIAARKVASYLVESSGSPR